MCALLSCLLLFAVTFTAKGFDGRPSTPLAWRRAALETELALARESPDAFYLILDLSARVGRLKMGGRVLREFPVRDHLLPRPGSKVQVLRLAARLDPGTAEPGNEGLRLRDRPLPLDFVGRQIEGPTTGSRLYCEPPFVLQSHHLPFPKGVPVARVTGEDLKALGSALTVGSAVILIPPLPGRRGSTS